VPYRALALTFVYLLVPAQARAAKDPKEAEARALFREAKRAYDLGRFQEALEGYSRAYQVKEIPAFLFNIAQVHRQLRHWDKATFFFRRYLDLATPSSENQRVVKELIAECEAKQHELEHPNEDKTPPAKEEAPQVAARPPPPHAPGPDDARRYLDSAKAFYEKLDFERALAQVRRATEASRTPDDDVKIALIEGILQANLGHDPEADAAFRKALALGPDAKLPFVVSPKVEEHFEAIRAQVVKVVSVRQLPEFSPRETSGTHPEAVEASAPPPSNGNTAAWVTGAAGATLLVGAGVSWLVAKGRYDAIAGQQIDPATALQYRNQGPTWQTTGWVLATSGMLALGASTAMFLWGGNGEVTATAAIVPGGAAVGISGVLW